MNEFLNMGGYGAYVWSAYGISLVVILLNIILPVRSRKRLMLDLKKRQQREAERS